MRVRRAVLVAGCLLACTGVGWAQDCLEPAGGLLSGEARAVDARGPLVFMGDGALFRVIDLSSPNSPVKVGSLKLEGRDIQSLAVDGDRVYVGTFQFLHIIDVSTPAVPVELGVLPYLDVAGSLVVLQGPRIEIIDVSNPAAPTSVSSMSPGSTGRNVALYGSWFFVAGGVSLHTFDLSDPALSVETNVFVEPREIASLDA